MRALTITLFVAGILAATQSEAAGGSSGGRSASSAGKVSSSGKSQSANDGGRAARMAAARRSALDGAKSKPSQKVVEVIREKERSGPGWIGTAALVYLLSRHDLSDSDRGWIQGRIDELKAEGEESGSVPTLLPAALPPVTFRFTGLQPQFERGEKLSVAVRAEAKGAVVPVECELSGATVTKLGQETQVTWEAGAEGVSVLSCVAKDHQVRRLVKVGR